jgi:hypothetical protein
VISGIAIFISSIDYPWLLVIGFIVMLILLTGIASILYSLVYQTVGPARYTNVDAVPTSHKGKKYSR